MPIYLKDGKRILHIHVPKTAGTSLLSFFGSNGFHVDWYDQGGETSLLPVLRCSRQHMHATMLMETLNFHRFDYVFMTVRNPITRMMSEHRMRQSIDPRTPDFGPWARSIMSRYIGDKYILDNHIRPQHEFWIGGCGVHRLEDGFDDAWIDMLEAKISIKFVRKSVPAAFRSKGERLSRDQLSKSDIAAITQFYKQDFLFFDYSPDIVF